MTSSSSLLILLLLTLAAVATAWPAPAADAPTATRRLTNEERDILRELLAERDFVLTNPVKARRSPSDEGFDFTSALRSIDNIQKPRHVRQKTMISTSLHFYLLFARSPL